MVSTTYPLIRSALSRHVSARVFSWLFCQASQPKAGRPIKHTKVRNGRGEIVGFAAELEVHPGGNLFEEDIEWNTEWILVLPGRGSVHLYQTENNWKFVKTVVLPTLITGKSWTGDWPDLHTLGPLTDGSGRIIGGSGEFQGITGSFFEIGTTKRFSPTGDLAGEIELRLCYRLPTG